MTRAEYDRLNAGLLEKGVILEPGALVAVRGVVSSIVDDAKREAYDAARRSAVTALSGMHNPHDLIHGHAPDRGCSIGCP